MERVATSVPAHEAPAVGRKARPIWLPYLLLVALAEVALLLALVPRDMALMDRVNNAKRDYIKQRQAWIDARNDPPIGTPLLTSAAGRLNEAVQKGGSRGATTLLFVGPCTKCAANRLNDWQRLVQHYSAARLIIVSRDTRAHIDKFVQSSHFSVPIVEDPEGHLAKMFNANWTPRVYQVDADGRLLWLQTDDGMHPHRIAAQLWRKPGESEL